MRFLKWAAFAVFGALALLALGYGFLYLQTQSRINRTYDVNPAPVAVAVSAGATGITGGVVSASPNFASSGSGGNGSTAGAAAVSGDAGVGAAAAAVAWGEHIATTRGCRDCHGEDLGGALFADAMPVFKVSASNLTPGGVGATYTDQDWVRAIRHGIRPDGKPLIFMPSFEYYHLGDQDLASLIAYLKTVPPVHHEVEENKVGPLGRILFFTGKLPLLSAELIDHDAPQPEAPPRGATVAYGEYLAVGCTGCHGPTFSGGPIPGVPPEWPPALNITQDSETGIGGWTREQFLAAVTQGKKLDGTQLQPQFMPWANFAHFEPDELEALWMYMQTVPARPYGVR